MKAYTFISMLLVGLALGIATWASGQLLTPAHASVSQGAAPAMIAQVTPAPTPQLGRIAPPNPLREGGPAQYVLLALPVLMLAMIIVAVRVHRARNTQ